jgi:DNA-damage-inducible protein D
MAKSKSIENGAFDFDDSSDSHFENLARTNGTRFWFARDLMRALGYDDWAAFKKAINKAFAACATLGINILENFIQCSSKVEGRSVEDFKLSRFACCLVALNGDSKKPNVAAAQAYFVSLALVIQDSQVPVDGADRVVMREEISEREVSLSKTAASFGLEFYDRFQNAGYRGMYNMEYAELKRLKGIPDLRRSLLDFMGKEELAGNLFRLTLTEGRIRRDQVRGQRALEDVAEQIGRRVRSAMVEETGVPPEQLPTGPDIREVRRGLKNTNKGFGRLDDVANERKQQALESGIIAESLSLTRSGLVPECPQCVVGDGTSHYGSTDCTSGSLASGGHTAHCRCDYCLIAENQS